jgi:hypothetical protein
MRAAVRSCVYVCVGVCLYLVVCAHLCEWLWVHMLILSVPALLACVSACVAGLSLAREFKESEKASAWCALCRPRCVSETRLSTRVYHYVIMCICLRARRSVCVRKANLSDACLCHACMYTACQLVSARRSFQAQTLSKGAAGADVLVVRSFFTTRRK